MNIVQSVSKSLSLRAECLKLEIRIFWEGDIILKMYKNIDKMIDANGQKLDYYNNLQFEMGNINKEIKKLDYITYKKSEMKKNIFNQVQRYSDVKSIAEEKFRHMCELNDKFPVIEGLLVNRLIILFKNDFIIRYTNVIIVKHYDYIHTYVST